LKFSSLTIDHSFFSFSIAILISIAIYHPGIMRLLLSSIVVFDDYRELIRDLTALTPMQFNYVVMVIHLLAFDFKLALLHRVLFEVDEETDDACQEQCSDGTTSDTRRFQHHARSGSCCVEEEKKG
jgi:hypothetical protein